MDNFTQIDNALFGVSDLPGAARFLWIVIRSFDGNGSGCFASVPKIAERSGYSSRQIFRLWKILVQRGFATEEVRRGSQTVRHVKLPDTYDKSGTSDRTDTSVENGSQLVSDLSLTSVENGSHKICTKSTIKKEQEPPSPPAEVRPTLEPPSKPKKPKKKSEIPKTLEAIEAELKTVDLDKFHAQFPDKDVDACWTQFYGTCVGENPRYPRLNPRNYHAGYFGKAFGNWLLNARDRPTPSSKPYRKSRIEVPDHDP